MSKRSDEMKQFKEAFLEDAEFLLKEFGNKFGKDYWRIKELESLVTDWKAGIITPKTSVGDTGLFNDELESHPELNKKVTAIDYWINKRAYWKSLGKEEWL